MTKKKDEVKKPDDQRSRRDIRQIYSEIKEHLLDNSYFIDDLDDKGLLDADPFINPYDVIASCYLHEVIGIECPVTDEEFYDDEMNRLKKTCSGCRCAIYDKIVKMLKKRNPLNV